MKFSVCCLTLLLFLSLTTRAQDSTAIISLEQILEEDPGDEPAPPSFKTTRIANGHSIEQCKRGILDMRINHRFGRISDGAYQFFGLDNAVTRIGFDYGVTERIMVGIGRSTLNKEFDRFVKVNLLGQTYKKIPLTVSYLAGAYVVTEKSTVEKLAFFNKVAYLHQLLVARRFNERLSIQVMPTWMHFNMTTLASETNSVPAAGIGGRFKLSKRTALTAEYHFVPDRFKRANQVNPLTIGLDIDTGGHVFQLFFSNATGISERSLLANTLSRWEKGQLHFGFNISRVFTVRE